MSPIKQNMIYDIIYRYGEAGPPCRPGRPARFVFLMECTRHGELASQNLYAIYIYIYSSYIFVRDPLTGSSYSKPTSDCWCELWSTQSIFLILVPTRCDPTNMANKNTLESAFWRTLCHTIHKWIHPCRPVWQSLAEGLLRSFKRNQNRKGLGDHNP